jgi:hypothetical protein
MVMNKLWKTAKCPRTLVDMAFLYPERMIPLLTFKNTVKQRRTVEHCFTVKGV